MVAVKINAFGGMVPASDARLIPDHAATLSQNCWLYSGELRGLVAPTLVKALVDPSTGKVYRIPINFFDTQHFNNATFMEFPDPNTDIVPSPIVGDTFYRYYWASSTGVPQLNSLSRIQAGLPPYSLGLNPPTAVLIPSITGGSGGTETRAYVTTFVSAFNEEGPPSLPTLNTGFTNGTWNLTLSPPSAPDVTKYNYAFVNIYRTVVVGGTATYFFVAQVALSTTTYADAATDAAVSLNVILPSTTWVAPPTNLQGIVALPNGMLAGWNGSNIYFCEPFRPHAWPAQYDLAVGYPIIGLGVTNQTLVVLTAAYPMVATGINPGSMTLSILTSLEPCMSRGSIISAPEGVYYASPNGLILVANGAASSVTMGLLGKDDWNNFLLPSTLRAARLGDVSYYCFGSSRPGVFEPTAWEPTAIDLLDYAGSYSGAIIDPTNTRVAFNALTSVTPMTNVFNDPWSGEAMLITNGNLYRLDIANETSARLAFNWVSKQFQPLDRKNFGALRVYFELPPWAPAGSTALTRNTDINQTLQPNQFGIVSVYANGVLVMCRELVASGELMKIPSGFKADYWQVGIQANVNVMSVQIATSDRELKKV
jgi:hypothetical protein